MACIRILTLFCNGVHLRNKVIHHASFNTTAQYRKIAAEERRECYDNLRLKELDGATS
jgi:hypothetical protein